MNTDTSVPGIEFRAVSKRYGDANSPMVVKGISFSVPKGTLTTILGPSGCGKTTTLRMIAGLEAPTSGQILIDGNEVTHLGPSERNVSMVFQSYALFPHMNVLDNVSYGLRASGVPQVQARERAMTTLESVGLKGFDARLPSELSGGQQQRVAVARALVLEPSVLLFDEPLSNLDTRLRRSMRDEIRSLQQSLGLTVAFVTHDQTEALALSDQIIVMDAGLIAQTGTPQNLYEQPRSSFVAGFMGDAMLFDGRALADGQVQIGSGESSLCLRPRHPLPPSLTGPADLRVAIRPEAWRICDPGPNALPGVVVRCAYLGSHLELTVQTSIGQLLVVSPEVQSIFNAGTAVHLTPHVNGVSVIES